MATRVTGKMGQRIDVMDDGELVWVCPSCNQTQVLRTGVRRTQIEAGIFRYSMGEHIQNAMSELSREAREVFMTGTCQKCWDSLS